jgi:NAD(P)H-binding
VLVRPTVLNDKSPRGKVRALTDLNGFRGGAVSRSDVARFVVEQLDSETWLHRAPLVTW